jgi:hypothetical protein
MKEQRWVGTFSIVRNWFTIVSEGRKNQEKSIE